MKYLYTICLLATTVFYSQAQRETYNWFFGYKTGITWNESRTFQATGLFSTPDSLFTDLPDLLTGSSIDTDEGCYSLSDPHGKLLFYSDGSTIWNKTHAVMENGTDMDGNSTSAQSGMILPYPEHPNQYISISVIQEKRDTLSYSIIDMNQNDGLGKVTSKNILFTGHSGKLGETVSSIRHPNGIDYWIVAPGRGTPTYLNAWLLTSSGISPSPIAITQSTRSVDGNVGGYLKFSPDGKHFAWGTWNGYLIYGDFNTYTGQFSNIRSISSSAYGVEFSPSGNYLYCSDDRSGDNIYVYDFRQLLNGVTNVYKTFTGQPIVGAFQLGPDGRIYMANRLESSLYIIDNPDEYSDLRIYKLDGYFPTKSVERGLPSFCASWFALSIEGEYSFCKDTPQTYQISITQNVGGSGSEQIAYTEWDFGDGNPVIKDTNVSSGTQTHTYTYAKPGNYTLTVRSYLANGSLAVQESLGITAYPCVLPVNPNIHLYETVK